MSFDTLLQSDVTRSGYLLIIRPRRICSTSWTGYSGDTFVQSFIYGFIQKLTSDGNTLTLGTSKDALSANQYWYDHGNKLLYVNLGHTGTGSIAPGAHQLIATYEIFISGEDQYWYRTPIDSTSQEVFYSGDLLTQPSTKADLTDVVNGYLPAQTTSIRLQNQEQFWDPHLYDSSFYRADVEIWVQIGDLDVSNVQRFYTGLVNTLDYQAGELTINMVDRVALLKDGFYGQFYQASETGTFLLYMRDTSSPQVVATIATDPNYIGRPKNFIVGVAEGVRAVNLTYNETDIRLQNNRAWAVAFGLTRGNGAGNGINTIDTQINLSNPSANTTTRTYLVSTSGIQVGDYPLFSGNGGAINIRRRVTAVTSTYIDHDALSASLASGGHVYVGHTAKVQVVMDQEIYDITDFVCCRDNGMSYILLGDSYVASAGLPRNVKPSDTVICKVYGDDTLPTIGGVTFGALDTNTRCVTNVVLLIYKILKDYLKIAESDLDLTSFQTAYSSVSVRAAYRWPQSTGGDYPTFGDIISQLLVTGLLRLSINKDVKWSMSIVGPMGSVNETLLESDYNEGSVSHEISYDDVLSDVIVQYYPIEMSSNLNEPGGTSRNAYVSNSTAKNLHRISRQRTILTCHLDDGEAQICARRLSYIFGDRRCLTNVAMKRAFLNTLIGDVAAFNALALPGFVFDGVNQNSRNMVVVGTTKSLSQTSLVLDDQKGIQDNAGSW